MRKENAGKDKERKELSQIEAKQVAAGQWPSSDNYLSRTSPVPPSSNGVSS
ncbi:hypothetical protein Csa_017192 [Cucumis sativus]|uniref:Uncharacterized protein n=1 Tax=Cucumis sativus TaxID=3659 RepID=A0A0A0K2Q0_CUCSA|nr:hypothetical protein Csa_017192 [Cucumis sativus]